MRKIAILFFLLVYSTVLFSQSSTIISPFADKNARKQQYKYLVDTSIYQYLAEPLNEDNEGLWNEAFWAMELLLYKNDFSKKKLEEAWNNISGLSEYFQKNLLEATYTLYPAEFTDPVIKLLRGTMSVPVFIRCAEYLLRADEKKYAPEISAGIISQFSGDNNTGLQVLKRRLANWNKPVVIPPLQDIFNNHFLKDKTVIYSLQRAGRDYAGLVIIRRPDGSFVMNEDGSLFHTSQLARAITDYPFYITNGNTPQGIFRWTGFEISKIGYIGPTPNLQLKMPNEVKPSVFFTDSGLVNKAWQKEMYASMLPESWKKYEGIYESFYAGIMGRYDIIMHGTTIDPAFYKGQTYYPQTPSLGCLCSYEAWDANGKRINSNQQQIVDALDSIESSEGYVVVIEIDDEMKAVDLEAIRKYLPQQQRKQ